VRGPFAFVARIILLEESLGLDRFLD
jgi:hypothetical protein